MKREDLFRNDAIIFTQHHGIRKDGRAGSASRRSSPEEVHMKQSDLEKKTPIVLTSTGGLRKDGGPGSGPHKGAGEHNKAAQHNRASSGLFPKA